VGRSGADRREALTEAQRCANIARQHVGKRAADQPWDRVAVYGMQSTYWLHASALWVLVWLLGGEEAPRP
jgi:hypothetical protein